MVALIGFAGVYNSYDLGNSKYICDGISISGVDVGGMTVDEAKVAVSSYVSGVSETEVQVIVNNDTFVATFGALGFEYSDDSYEENAFEVGKKGSIFEKITEISNAEKGKIYYDLDFSINEKVLTKFIKRECKKYNIKVKNSTLKFENGVLTATKEKSGVAVNVKDSKEDFLNVLNDALVNLDSSNKVEQGITLQAVCKVVEPEYTKAQLKECNDLLGSFDTSYATSTPERATNVEVAAGRINGTILYPGDTFSTIKTIKKRTVKNGYKKAAEYSNGKVVDGIGGGVCQVATTLYNAVINAELEVKERKPHQMVVSYVPVARDAAISGDVQDFKFVNNLEYPVYIVAQASGGLLKFDIYGHETRAEDRTISFDTEIIETYEPGESVEEVDETKPVGYREVTQTAHTGYKAKLWKYVYVNGVQVEKIEVNTSEYNAVPEYITVGPGGTTGEEESTASASPESTAAADDTTSNTGTTATTAPSSTKTPTATKAPAATKAPTDNSNETTTEDTTDTELTESEESGA